MELELLRAIIVDDEINARKIVPIIIDWQAVGYRFVGEASNGSEALDLIETMKPDVVFTDISMPFMDGLELSRLIKERYPLVKIVIITASRIRICKKKSGHWSTKFYLEAASSRGSTKSCGRSSWENPGRDRAVERISGAESTVKRKCRSTKRKISK